MMPDRNEFIEGFNMGRIAGAEGRESRLKSGRKWYNAGYNNGYDVGQCKCWDINAEGAFLEVITELLSQCAAGPWQPMDTTPELEDVLIKVKYGDEIKVMIACRYENHWMHDYDQDRMQDDGKITAWAALNPELNMKSNSMTREGDVGEQA